MVEMTPKMTKTSPPSSPPMSDQSGVRIKSLVEVTLVAARFLAVMGVNCASVAHLTFSFMTVMMVILPESAEERKT